ncbi:hypothetical protein [Methylobacterium sp. J-092]|uniref:hypothetical protein n=1 Tax=Methylobacterium sp. J-092 TaxID=2836667 RepID=UPI001FB90306|nr:hypothetical protein [Methylobacterium sp. J-092]MCJ2007481.1 hypothetical protein [Methylobacterium sp. J-092]
MHVPNVTIGLPSSVPIFAKAVRAGLPSPADEFIKDQIDLQQLLIGSVTRLDPFHGSTGHSRHPDGDSDA